MKNKHILQAAVIAGVIGITTYGAHAFAYLPGMTSEFDTTLNSLSHNLSNNLALNGEISNDQILQDSRGWLPPEVFPGDPFVEDNNDMELKEGEALAAHTAELSNDTNTDQTLNTASFAYTQTDSVSTTNSHTAGFDMTTTAEMKFPLISGSMSMTVKYEYNNSKEVTSSTTKEWDVPSQSILVPAGKKYKVDWILKTGVATGTVNLTRKVTGEVSYMCNEYGGGYNSISMMPIGTAIEKEKAFEQSTPNTAFIWGDLNNWETLDSNTALSKSTVSNYTAKYGTELIMHVSDLSDEVEGQPKVIKSIKMDINPVVDK
jgi:hypothetical protein